MRLESAAGTPLQAMRTDAEGKFTFAKLQSGRYRLRTFAPGIAGPQLVQIDVPSATGSYEVAFT